MIDGRLLWALLDCIRRCLSTEREQQLITEIMELVDELPTLTRGEK